MSRRAFATLVAVALLTTACSAAAPLVPADLLGTWQTDEPRYAHAYLRIGAGEVVFGTGETVPSRHPIVAIDSEFGPSGTLYTIEYRVGQTVARLGVVHEQRDGATLRLRNQPSFSWRRQRPS